MRQETQNPEPSAELVEAFESVEDRTRRKWAESGADWSWQILKFLQGRRVTEISLTEILTTQTYARSTLREQNALKFVASQAEQRNLQDEEDRRRLIERDIFLIRFIAGETLGHHDWVSEIQGIPFAVRRAQELDAALFPRTYSSPQLFTWIWAR
jgi:hypothetical protein